MLAKTVTAALSNGAVPRRSLERVIADTTVMGKALTHPTAAQLVEACRRRLVKQAQEAKLKLRQNYHRVGPALSVQVARYAHARQGQRLARCLKHQKTITGRVVRDIERHLPQVAPEQLAQRWQQAVTLVRRVLAHKRTDKGKMHRLHEPQVDCIAKDQSRHRHECDTQVSVTATWPDNLVAGMAGLPGNPYAAHTLGGTLRRVGKLTGVHPREVYIAGARRGMATAVRKRRQRRNAVEPIIGHLKAEGRLGLPQGCFATDAPVCLVRALALPV